MTDGERRAGSGDTKDNVRDELDTAEGQGKDASKEAVEEEEQTGGPGGVKDNVKDEWDEAEKQ